MGWINTADKSLVNSDALREIKLFELKNEKENFSLIEIMGIFFDGQKIVLGYADGPDGAEELIGSALSKQFYLFTYTFREACENHHEKIKALKEENRETLAKDDSKFNENFEEYWDESHIEISRIRKACSIEEIEVDLYL